MKFQVKKTHEYGDIRIVKRFALFPIEIYPVTIWLEIVYIKQKWTEGMGGELGGITDHWWNRKFVTEEEYKKYVKGCL